MTQQALRAEWMKTLARANAKQLKHYWESLEGAPSWSLLRAPEIGLAMVQGRIGGDGPAFNLGEVTVTRCSVALEEGTHGYACVKGRQKTLALHAALLDALLQDERWYRRILEELLHPIRRQLQEQEVERDHRVQRTRVDFFTLVRGETA